MATSWEAADSGSPSGVPYVSDGELPVATLFLELMSSKLGASAPLTTVNTGP